MLNISASILKETTDLGTSTQVLEPTPEKSITMDNLLEKLETNQADTGEEGQTHQDPPIGTSSSISATPSTSKDEKLLIEAPTKAQPEELVLTHKLQCIEKRKLTKPTLDEWKYIKDYPLQKGRRHLQWLRDLSE